MVAEQLGTPRSDVQCLHRYSAVCFIHMFIYKRLKDVFVFQCLCSSYIDVLVFSASVILTNYIDRLGPNCTHDYTCLWSLRIVPSLPGSRFTVFYRDASSALLQLVN